MKKYYLKYVRPDGTSSKKEVTPEVFRKAEERYVFELDDTVYYYVGTNTLVVYV